jgi:hypothetical protein
MKPVKKGFHRHHKVPVHAGGTDDDENIVYLTVEEHIQAHLDLYEKYGKDADLDAAHILRACIYRENDEVKYENFIRSCVRGGKAAHEVKTANGFYKRLGEHNAKVLKGRDRPDLAAAKRQEWEEFDWKWFNNGVEERRFPEPVEGWIAGRLFSHLESTKQIVSQKMSMLKWFTNGIENRRLAQCPPGWKPGRKKNA